MYNFQVSWRLLSSSMLCICIATLTLVVMIFRGLIFHPCAFIASTNGLYLSLLAHGLVGVSVVHECKIINLYVEIGI